jgi:alpha-methylacyl-CoA racemase
MEPTGEIMGALAGIKILELARVSPAELSGMMLADMGADVLKIETPHAERPSGGEWARRTIFTFTNRNKRSMTLDMKSPDGQAIFGKLAANVDVIVEGFRPGVMERLGAGYETIRALNPRIVYCSLSGFGQDGPYRSYPAHDMNYLSLAGVLGLIGEPGRKPVIPLNIIADYAGASLHGTLGIALALFARERSGRGQHVDVSYLDSSVALLAATPSMRYFFSDGLAPRRGEGFLGGAYPYYAIYETRGEAAHDRLHGALALGKLLPRHRPARLCALRPVAGPARARRQRRGGSGTPGDRGDHPHT